MYKTQDGMELIKNEKARMSQKDRDRKQSKETTC
jgi:hypothetical protein